MLEKLLDNGMDIMWLNFSHGTQQIHGDMIDNLRQALKNRPGRRCAIAVELKGPKIRTGLVNNGAVNLVAGSEVTVTTDTSVVGNEKTIVIDFPNLVNVVKDKILIEDGVITLTPVSIDLQKREIKCTVNNSAVLGDNKIVHLPGAVLNLPAMSPKDKEDLLFALSKGVDVVCSVIRTPWNVQQLRDTLSKGGQHVKIIAKIESTEGVDNFNLVLAASDGILVSRGDLGVILPMEQVFKVQKMMISRANASSKPVIVSTQMLESMIKNPRPTRAEATDVANAVLDGTECVMLSGETAYGDYPVEALTYMNSMCKEAEAVETVGDYPSLFEALKAETKDTKLPEVISSYSVRSANDLKAALIIVLTETGGTGRMVCKYRPRVPVLVITEHERTAEYLMFTRGTVPLVLPKDAKGGETKRVSQGMEWAKQRGLCKSGDLVVVTLGVVEGVSGASNSFKILTVP